VLHFIGGEDDGAGEEEGCPEGTTEYTWSYEGSYSSEVSWDLVDANNEVAASGDGTSGTACIADGEYTANMYDSYGDGWDGTVTFYDADGAVAASIWMMYCSYWDNYDGVCNGSQISATVAFGGAPQVSGCTDAGAPEYDPAAELDDGSCWADCPYPSWTSDGYCDGSNTVAGSYSGAPASVQPLT
jgi:hypothetical protein